MCLLVAAQLVLASFLRLAGSRPSVFDRCLNLFAKQRGLVRRSLVWRVWRGRLSSAILATGASVYRPLPARMFGIREFATLSRSMLLDVRQPASMPKASPNIFCLWGEFGDVRSCAGWGASTREIFLGRGVRKRSGSGPPHASPTHFRFLRTPPHEHRVCHSDVGGNRHRGQIFRKPFRDDVRALLPAPGSQTLC